MSNLTPTIIKPELVGQVSVVGECYCFGLALHGHIPIYLDIAGPATSVEAVWAKLSLGKACAVTRYMKSTIWLQPVKEAMYTRFQRRIPELRVDHLIIVNKAATQPVYAEKGATYIIRTSPDQANAKIIEHVTNLVHVAVFPEWYDWLIDQAYKSNAVTRCNCYGQVDVLKVNLDRMAWTSLISEGLRDGLIKLPLDK